MFAGEAGAGSADRASERARRGDGPGRRAAEIAAGTPGRCPSDAGSLAGTRRPARRRATCRDARPRSARRGAVRRTGSTCGRRPRGEVAAPNDGGFGAVLVAAPTPSTARGDADRASLDAAGFHRFLAALLAREASEHRAEIGWPIHGDTSCATCRRARGAARPGCTSLMFVRAGAVKRTGIRPPSRTISTPGSATGPSDDRRGAARGRIVPM